MREPVLWSLCIVLTWIACWAGAVGSLFTGHGLNAIALAIMALTMAEIGKTG